MSKRAEGSQYLKGISLADYKRPFPLFQHGVSSVSADDRLIIASESASIKGDSHENYCGILLRHVPEIERCAPGTPYIDFTSSIGSFQAKYARQQKSDFQVKFHGINKEHIDAVSWYVFSVGVVYGSGFDSVVETFIFSKEAILSSNSLDKSSNGSNYEIGLIKMRELIRNGEGEHFNVSLSSRAKTLVEF